MTEQTNDVALVSHAAVNRSWEDLPLGWTGDGLVMMTMAAVSVRHETFEERPHVVVSAVLVRSQVLNNNLGAMYLPAEAITDEWAATWNGIPVLLGDHPSHLGQQISGRSPSLWNERRVGHIFHARADTEPGRWAVRRLVAEVWLDATRVSHVEGLGAVLESLDAGRPVELSTGFLTRLERRNGEHAGRQYEAVMLPQAPDHLVVSTELTGACSVSDGCGLGANAETTEEDTMADNVEPQTAKQNTSMLGGFGRFIARLFGTDENEEQLVDQIEEEARVHAWKVITAEQIAADNLTDPSDDDRAQALRDALQKMHGGRDHHVIVVDVFNTAPMRVIYFISSNGGEPDPPGSLFYQVEFSEGDDGSFSFGDAETVRRMTRYDPVAGNTADEDSQDPATQGADAEITDDGTEIPMTDVKNTEELTAQISALAASVETLTSEVQSMKTAAEADPNPAIAGLKRTIGELADKVNGMATVTQTAVAERERERQSLVHELAGHFRVPYTAEELENKPIEELRKLRIMANGEGGRGGPRSGYSGNAEEARFAEPVPYWLVDPKTKDGARA